ncbi:MAG: alpha-amylase/4-alpha-glucanotransferase domain-containing protein, partial [Actinomycetota bacterium]
LEQEKHAGRIGQHRPFLRGGIWRNFLSRYPEANWAHKRMQGLSDRLAAQPRHSPALTARLYKAQANDAYWHGLFGGLYLPHLRRAVWNNIAALEAELDRRQPRPAIEQGDFDLDGRVETACHDAKLQVVVRDDGLAAARELISYPLSHNFGDTLCRYREHYHDRISQGASREHQGDGIASAHDIVRFKDPVAPEDIIPDTLPRALWLDFIDEQPLVDYVPDEKQALTYHRSGVEKRYELADGRLTVTWRFTALAGRRFATVLNLAMPSCDGFLGRYVLADGSIPGGFGQPLEQNDARKLKLEDGVLGGAVEIALGDPANLRGRPHRTVSQSEAGFEKIMQAVELTFAWDIPGDDFVLTCQFNVQPQP